MREKVRAPFGPCLAVTKTISTPATITPVFSIEGKLASSGAWGRYRLINGREAVYLSLEAVFRCYGMMPS